MDNERQTKTVLHALSERTHTPLVSSTLCVTFLVPSAHNTRHAPQRYSHSMVPGGLLVMSYTTRLTERTPLQMRLDTVCRNLGSNGYQSAVMPSPLVTARRATTLLCVRWSPCTPTDLHKTADLDSAVPASYIRRGIYRGDTGLMLHYGTGRISSEAIANTLSGNVATGVETFGVSIAYTFAALLSACWCSCAVQATGCRHGLSYVFMLPRAYNGARKHK